MLDTSLARQLIKSWRFHETVHSEEFVRELVSLEVSHESIRVLIYCG